MLKEALPAPAGVLLPALSGTCRHSDNVSGCSYYLQATVLPPRQPYLQGSSVALLGRPARQHEMNFIHEVKPSCAVEAMPPGRLSADDCRLHCGLPCLPDKSSCWPLA